MARIIDLATRRAGAERALPGLKASSAVRLDVPPPLVRPRRTPPKTTLRQRVVFYALAIIGAGAIYAAFG